MCGAPWDVGVCRHNLCDSIANEDQNRVVLEFQVSNVVQNGVCHTLGKQVCIRESQTQWLSHSVASRVVCAPSFL